MAACGSRPDRAATGEVAGLLKRLDGAPQGEKPQALSWEGGWLGRGSVGSKSTRGAVTGTGCGGLERRGGSSAENGVDGWWPPPTGTDGAAAADRAPVRAPPAPEGISRCPGDSGLLGDMSKSRLTSPFSPNQETPDPEGPGVARLLHVERVLRASGLTAPCLPAAVRQPLMWPPPGLPTVPLKLTRTCGRRCPLNLWPGETRGCRSPPHRAGRVTATGVRVGPEPLLALAHPGDAAAKGH